MIAEYMKRVWIAEAPAGTWSTGPSVCWDLPGVDSEPESVRAYRRMGWTVHGPYVLQEAPSEQDFEVYLDAWLQNQGVLMHSTTLERIADGAHEFYKGRQRTYAEWQNAPRGPDNRPLP